MQNGNQIVDGIIDCLSQVHATTAMKNQKIVDLLEAAILSDDPRANLFAIRLFYLMAATALPALLSGNEPVSIDFSASDLDWCESDDEKSADEFLSRFGLTEDDAIRMVRFALQARTEARRKSGLIK